MNLVLGTFVGNWVLCLLFGVNFFADKKDDSLVAYECECVDAVDDELVSINGGSMYVKIEPIRPTQKMRLFNGKDLSGWVKVINAEPDACPDQTWRVENGVIRCSGTPFGYLRTQNVYADYKLHVEYRWADKTTETPNSGIFTFTTGSDYFFLPTAIETQLKMGHAGDLVSLPGATFNRAENSEVQFIEKLNVMLIKKREASSEKPRGQWNSVDIYVEKDTIRSFVNGVLQNEGTDVYVDYGHICLQSEGGAIDFRNITLEPVF